MNIPMEQYRQAADYIRARLNGRPEECLVLGSGLGRLAGEVEDAVKIPYAEIPGFPRSTVASHAGMLVCGKLCGRTVIVMAGRFHYYEGYAMEDVVLPIRVMGLLGAKRLVLTNAAGGIGPGLEAGDLMLLTGHIAAFVPSPLIGSNVEELGPRFPDMTEAYSPRLREKALAAARRLGIPLKEGVYLQTTGPQYETPAEVRAARLLGADAVGMSTVPEAIVAAHCGMEVLGFTLCTNMAAGVLDQPLSSDEVIAAGQAAGPRFSALVKACLTRL